MRARPQKPRLRKVYILPNLFTALNLFLGMLAIFNVLNGHLGKACWFIFLATLLDTMDGAVALLTRTQSEFGLQFDSLSDVISFGAAPAFASFAFMRGALVGIDDRLITGACALFAVCGALRLARYNVQAHGPERKGFVGLPIDAGAGTVILTILAFLESLIGTV